MGDERRRKDKVSIKQWRSEKSFCENLVNKQKSWVDCLLKELLFEKNWKNTKNFCDEKAEAEAQSIIFEKHLTLIRWEKAFPAETFPNNCSSLKLFCLNFHNFVNIQALFWAQRDNILTFSFQIKSSFFLHEKNILLRQIKSVVSKLTEVTKFNFSFLL